MVGFPTSVNIEKLAIFLPEPAPLNNQPSTFRLSQQILAWTLKSQWQKPRTLSGLREITGTFRSEK
jgi:hypothetical protein